MQQATCLQHTCWQHGLTSSWFAHLRRESGLGRSTTAATCSATSAVMAAPMPTCVRRMRGDWSMRCQHHTPRPTPASVAAKAATLACSCTPQTRIATAMKTHKGTHGAHGRTLYSTCAGKLSTCALLSDTLRSHPRP